MEEIQAGLITCHYDEDGNVQVRISCQDALIVSFALLPEQRDAFVYALMNPKMEKVND